MVSGRIDKLEIWLKGSLAAGYEEAEAFAENVKLLAEGKGLKGNWCDTKSHKNPMTKQWERYFEVWGEPAHLFARDLPAVIWNRVIRIDYRIPIEGDHPTADEVFNAACRKDPKGKRANRRIQSPPRTKTGSRDVGGTTFVSGGTDSDVIFSYYQRGNEAPAAEMQLNGAGCKNLIQVAAHSYMAINGKELVDYILEHLDKLMNKISVERIGCEVDALSNGKWYRQLGVEEQQEILLWETITSFYQLSPENKQQFLKDNGLLPEGE